MLESGSFIYFFNLRVTKAIVMFILSSATLPFNIKNKISMVFTQISQFTFFIIGYLIVILFIDMFRYNKHYTPKSNPKYVPVKFDTITFFKYYGNFIYAFNCIGTHYLKNLTPSQYFRHEESIKKETRFPSYQEDLQLHCPSPVHLLLLHQSYRIRLFWR